MFMDPSREGRLERGKKTRVVEVERFEKMLPTVGGGTEGGVPVKPRWRKSKAVALFCRLAGRVLTRPVT